MDALETTSESNAKISDSAYSNSCSNSQSKRSHSSKSTHCGSHSSGSSGYGGKLSSSGSSNVLEPPEKRSKDKEAKKKKTLLETCNVECKQELLECRPPDPTPIFDNCKELHDVGNMQSSGFIQGDKGVENMEICVPERSISNDEMLSSTTRPIHNVLGSRTMLHSTDRFSCVISMHDGVVMYTTSSLTCSLGFPKDMWIGRSFIDFIHPKDRDMFASQITSGLAVPKNIASSQEKDDAQSSSISTMFCRIRRYRGLGSGFGVKDRLVIFTPFLLRLAFKNVNEEEGKIIYLVIQATPFFSAFNTSNEVITKPVPFVTRHVANGSLEYIDPESVPYLGYLPQDIINKDALQLYHPEDLPYLEEVYELIVKEGGMSRCKPYRMLSQNGDYVKLETEWSTFINPWSRKLEFVIGKHFVIEGPTNPDVFQNPEREKEKKADEENEKFKKFRENVIRIMNEVLTKPAEVAKQQMTKRCQDLASFMESLMEEPSKTDEEMRLDIHDPDHSYYERDSVMLGGISPHHDFNDCKSSTETPISYNQLNYNENIQRYFESHQYVSFCEEYNKVTETLKENDMDQKESNNISNCFSPMALNSGDSGDITSSGESNGCVVRATSPVKGEYQLTRLTESLLSKHNKEMEKDLVKRHREHRANNNKVDREKVSNEMRQKKKEHLARCNAAYQPTSTGCRNNFGFQPHGVKRSSIEVEDDKVANKQQRASPRQTRRKPIASTTCPQAMNTVNTTVAGTSWPTTPVNTMNTYLTGIMPQQMSVVSPVAAVTDVFPMYYVPTAGVPDVSTLEANTNLAQFQAPAMQYMMYGQAVFGSPFVYSAINPPMSYPMQQSVLTQNMQYDNVARPLGFSNRNYEEACKSTMQLKTHFTQTRKSRRLKKRLESQEVSPKADKGNGVSDSDNIGSSSNTLINRESGAVSSDSQSGNQNSAMDLSDIQSSNSIKSNKPAPGVSKPATSRPGNSEETRTDGESSYSSFYSSFFKTESGSAEDSGDTKKKTGHNKQSTAATTEELPKRPKRKIEPPWMEKVSVTSELVYKYQIHTKSLDEVLSADKEKITKFQQPSMVNEQLGQLYLDLQLEGVAARLTLEETTSSGSSGEETGASTTKSKIAKIARKKREYSKLVMIYEEDAPLPSPTEEDAEMVFAVPTSTSS